jgi:AcrR family transcriptional regulator
MRVSLSFQECYSQSVREQARTRLARRAVIDAARTLFLEQGYAATTVEAISKAADVPPATLYRLFASKLGILKVLLDTSIAGDDEPVAVAARPDVASLFDEPDPADLLAGFAGVTTDINQRTNDVHRVLVGAASSDPAAAELLAEIREQRDRGQRQIVRALSGRKELREGLRAREAEDVVHALMAPEVYRLLVVDRGWAPERYRTWLGATLAQQLL